MIFSRKSAATRALHDWMSDCNHLTHDRAAWKGWDAWEARIPAIMAQQPDLKCKFKGVRPLAWCLSISQYSRSFLEYILAYPSDAPGALDPMESVQDVVDVAQKQLHTEYVVRALSKVLLWTHCIPPSAYGSNATLPSKLVSMQPEVDHLLLEKLRLAGYDPNIGSPKGYTVAHATVANNANKQALEWAMAHCNLEAVDYRGRTALAIGIEVGNPLAVSLLLKAGAKALHPSAGEALEFAATRPLGQSMSSLAIRDMVQARASEAGLKDGTSVVIPEPRRSQRPRF